MTQWNANNLKLLRNQMGWSQSDLAFRLGLVFTQVQSWESGDQAPSQEMCEKLEQLFRHSQLATSDLLAESTVEEIFENSIESTRHLSI